jgi:hypothetical protein
MPSNRFDALTSEQQEFLISYTKHRGDIDEVITELAIPGNDGWETTYNANMILLDVLRVLGVPDKNYENYIPTWPYTSVKDPKASDVVRAVYYHKQLSYGHNTPMTYTPRTHDYRYLHFYCTDERVICRKELNSGEVDTAKEIYRYEVLDLIVELLIDNLGFVCKGTQTGKNAYTAGTLAGWYKANILNKSPCKSNEGKLAVYYAILKLAGMITEDEKNIYIAPQYCALF